MCVRQKKILLVHYKLTVINFKQMLLTTHTFKMHDFKDILKNLIHTRILNKMKPTLLRFTSITVVNLNMLRNFNIINLISKSIKYVAECIMQKPSR